MKALYRRYRPKSLEEVIGQSQITDILKKSLASDKLAHAYLFVGPRGCGKTSVARILAHEINHFPYELEDEYLDIIEIDAASNTGVDNIRDLREKAIIAPAQGKYKVYIIDEVHMLSKSAFNALLKTLEEPPAHVIFIMATTDAHKVPVTISSRSQVFTFKLADPSTMLEHLKKIAKTEKIDITEDALKIIVKRGGGSFRDTLSILDQISSLSEQKIDAGLVNSALGLPQDEIILQLLDAYRSANLDQIRAQLNSLFDANIKAESIADSLITQILSAPEPALLPLLDKLTEVSRASYPQIKLLLALANPAVVQVASAPRIVAAPTPIAAPAPTPAPVLKPKPKPEPKPETKPEPAPEAPMPEPAPAAVATVTTISPSASDAELWQQVLNHIEQNAKIVLKYLQDSDYQIQGTTLTIYAKKKFARDQIIKKKNIVMEILPDNYTVEVNAKTLAKDQTIADIAALMGGGEEVQIDA